MNATGPDREGVRRWLDHLRFERRLSALTVQNYHRDIEALYTFLCNADRVSLCVGAVERHPQLSRVLREGREGGREGGREEGYK